jgi:hypothetical protein
MKEGGERDTKVNMLKKKRQGKSQSYGLFKVNPNCYLLVGSKGEYTDYTR